MKALSLCLIAMVMASTLSIPSRAADSGDCPTCYVSPLNTHAPKGKMTHAQMEKLSAQIHGVNYLTSSDNTTEPVAAPLRPTGTVTLNAVINVGNTDSSSSLPQNSVQFGNNK